MSRSSLTEQGDITQNCISNDLHQQHQTSFHGEESIAFKEYFLLLLVDFLYFILVTTCRLYEVDYGLFELNLMQLRPR